MTTTAAIPDRGAAGFEARHPLQPLTAEEIRAPAVILPREREVVRLEDDGSRRCRRSRVDAHLEERARQRRAPDRGTDQLAGARVRLPR